MGFSFLFYLFFHKLLPNRIDAKAVVELFCPWWNLFLYSTVPKAPKITLIWKWTLPYNIWIHGNLVQNTIVCKTKLLEIEYPSKFEGELHISVKFSFKDQQHSRNFSLLCNILILTTYLCDLFFIHCSVQLMSTSSIYNVYFRMAYLMV